jgi:hypothetical protein
MAGDHVDFWRVVHSDRESGRLLLFAEMKMPGNAWLDYRVEDTRIKQRVVFEPFGIIGRIYWYVLLPVHNLMFQGLIEKIALKNH